MKKLKTKKAKLLPVLFACLLLGACNESAQKTAAAPGPVEVNVLTLKTQPINLTVDLPGRTAAYRIAEVRPQVSGIVQKRLFTEGSEVKAGQLLYQIDPATYQAGFESAKATLAKVEAQELSTRLKADRYRTLVRTKAVSEQDQIEMEANWKQAVADVAAAKAALSSARINLEYTRVTAPITGRIGKSMISEGALVTAQQGTSLSTIQQLDPLYIDVSQSTTELVNLKKELASGQSSSSERPKSEVKVLLADGSEYGQTGILEFSDVTVNQTTGSVTLRAMIANPQQELLPGMFVRARIGKGSWPNAILVPAASVSRNNKGQATVMLVNEQSTVENRIIQTGQNLGDQVLVTEGLAAGEQLIVAGLQKIKPGSPVKTVSPPALTAAPAAVTKGV